MKFAISGCSIITKKHVQTIKNKKGQKLFGVCDRVQKLMKPFIANHSVILYPDLNGKLVTKRFNVMGC